MPISLHKITVNTTGSAASATGSEGVAVPHGEFMGVYFDFNSAAPSTTDTTITTTGGPVTGTILTITDSKTDAWYHPGEQMDGDTGSTITGAYKPPLVFSHITIALAGCDPLTAALIAWVYVKS